MQRFKIFVDTENGPSYEKPKLREKERQALGEIKNTIITRSKFSELNNGLKNIKLKDPVKLRPKRSIAPKKVVTKKTIESPDDKYISPQIKRKRRLSSMLKVSEYANDIYKYLLHVEDKYPIKDCAKFEKKFGEMTRFALVDWLVEINEHFRFINETLQLCIAIIDRYVQDEDSLIREDLQLIALASAFIASKYEEIVPMELNDLLFVCESTISPEEILKMETKIVTKMQYSFGRPVPAHFIRRYCNVVQATNIEQSCAFYLSDIALMSYKLCYLKPSIIAASAFCVALFVSNGQINKSVWNSTLIKYSTYEVHDLEDCMVKLARCMMKLSATRFQAVQRKYSKPKYFNVSQLPELKKVIEELAL